MRNDRNVLLAASFFTSMMLVACGGGTTTPFQPSQTGSTLVQTDKGPVQGTIGAGGVRAFAGIPFAAPPIGVNRFAAPQPAAAWTAPIAATTPAPPCPQTGSATQNTTEDCLYLNVWAPVQFAGSVPVLVFLYGGGFTQGNGAAYDGSLLAARDNIIVVTPNYRNGLFGFLANSALDTGGGNTGNYAIEDQQAALKWVKRNIASFGGDPNNVTLGGESAGAMSVCMNLASPGAAGTFVRTIVESGPCSTTFPTLAQQESALASIPSQLGCSGAAAQVATCLRAVSLQQILNVQNALPRGTLSPSIGGADMPNQPRFALGIYPMLMGGNALEAGYTVLLNPPASLPAYEAALAQAYGANAGAVEAQYPYGSYANGGIALSSAETDWSGGGQIQWCGDVRSFSIMQTTNVPLYAYEFNDPSGYAFTGAKGPVHTAELPYLFPKWNNVYPPAGLGVAAGSQTLSNTMIEYWGNFVKYGNPNDGSVPSWPAYTGPTTAMQLTPNSIAPGVDVAAEHKCSFWNSLGFAL